MTLALALTILAAGPRTEVPWEEVPWEEVPWEEVLAPRAEWPAPLEEVVWRADLARSRALARETGRPLFVSLRCVPCKQCASFDAALLEGGAELDPLLRQFVTVRLTDAADLDLRVLPAAGYQDLDLSWWGYLLTPDGAPYAIFGGRDHVSDTTRISTAALAHTLRRVLDHHYDPRRSGWGIDPPAPDLTGAPASPTGLPGYAPWLAANRWARDQDCLHCHQVADVLRQPALAAGTFDKARDVQVWPLPENVGLTVDRDHGLRVTAVTGAAAAAGVRVGDVLGAAHGVRLFGQADLRGVLHRGPRGAGELLLVWSRSGTIHTGTLILADGWRRTVLDWRMSISQGVIGAGPGFWPNRGPRAGSGTLSLRPWFGKEPSGPAWDAGLRGGDEVIAVDDEHPDLVGRAFLVWFRARYDPGDEITLTVRSSGIERVIEYELHDDE